ncbi:MAG: type IV pili methyl-accepting chemotaxis transducer N-terminal domain-containing protein, partial [Gammaproteobacteria bacterium]
MKLALKKPLKRGEPDAKKKKKKSEAGAGAGGGARLLVGLLIGLLAVAGVAAIVWGIVQLDRIDFQAKQRLSEAASQQVISQQIAKYTLEAADGDSEAFNQLKRLVARFEASLNRLSRGDGAGLPGSSAPELAAVRSQWGNYREKVSSVLNNQDVLVAINEQVSRINELIPQLLTRSDELVGILVETEADQYQVYIASRQLLLTQRIQNSVDRLLSRREGAATAADQFGRDAAFFGHILEGQLRGDQAMNIEPIEDEEALEKLAEIAEIFSQVNDDVDLILKSSPEFFAVQAAAQETTGLSERVLNSSAKLEEAFAKPAKARDQSLLAVYVGGALIVLAVVLIGYAYFARQRSQQVEARGQAEKAERQNKENQDAIIGLLDEIEGLSSGDLTVEATVSEAFTGHIADAFNQVVESLRSIVITINDTAGRVSGSAEETQATARQLAEASEHQARQITSAGESISSMAREMDSVSSSALESAEVARRSVEIASKGADTVRRTITGMDQIRDNIQETSKRIKRLG